MMNDTEIDTLRDIALALEESNPRAAFELMSIASKYRPDGPLILERLKFYKKKIFNKVLTCRSDGTTERLNAVINGMFLARSTGFPLLFSWLDDEGKIPNFFNSAFVKHHYISNEAMGEYRVHGYDVPVCEMASGEHVFDGPDQAENEGFINLIPRLLYSGPRNYEVKELVDTLLAPDYVVMLEKFKSICTEFTGLHYRGGDVIYGNERYNYHVASGKSEALSVVEQFVSDNEESKILIFGTPTGNTLKDLLYLEEKYPQVFLSKDLCVPGYDDVIQDSLMMSCCRRMVGKNGTGVIRFAQHINPNLNVNYFEDLYSDEDFVRLLREGANNTEYSDLQRAFHAINALKFTQSSQGLRDLLGEIEALDPSNPLEWWREANPGY